jgi:hypothetical protein
MTRRPRRATRTTAIGFALLLIGACLAGCGSGAQAVSVFPIPGSRVASPQTQIAFRGVPVSRLGKVIVTGSRSGRHAGRLVSDSDGRGGSFLPSKPFVPGEVVTVTAKLRGGDATGRTYRFTVATPAGAIPALPLPPAPRVPSDQLTLLSRPDLAPPSVEVTKQSSSAAAGDIFLTP